ncbi:MAG: RNase J family beta-CASP ribonuclease [Nanoarchaeota archaeon]|nr:RNase J family beta-CASP ribonuclease [Nanoarchaeota archaeon]
MEIFTIGGYSEVGKNMTAIKVDDEIIICDMGLFLPKLLSVQEEGDPRDLPTNELMKLGVIPNDSVLEKERDKVKAILFGHCHLDHIGAAPYLSKRYNCPSIGTPYTLEILKTLYEDKKLKPKNELKVLNANSSIKISKNFTIEFINITHSTLQVVLIAIHTPEGIILYGNDFKFDNHPVLGKRPNYELLKKLGDKGVKCLILDCLNSRIDMKTPSEKVARELLKDVMLGTSNKGNAVIVTTFSSHISRLRSIIDFGKKMNRKIVFMGRSLHKYVTAAEKIKLINFSKEVEICGYRRLVQKRLKEISKNREKYLIVCTGNQGEPDATLSRMARGELPFEFKPNDEVIFSCRTIPTIETMRNRELLEKKLRQKGVRIFTQIHASGHASREDHRDIINMTKPEHLIPAHGDFDMTSGLLSLATEIGYIPDKTVHLMHDGSVLKI